VGNYDAFRAALEAEGYDWYGDGDRVHYDYRGPGAIDLRGTSVLAFQRLWNINEPSDPIDEDGVYGAMTEARLARAPAGGFPRGSTCEGEPPPPEQAPFAAELIAVVAPERLEAGTAGEVRVSFRNTGTATWTPARTRLGTTGPRDRDSTLAAPDWIAPNRPAHVQAETPPGAVGVFTFPVLAPPVSEPRAFDEDFALVEEAVTWFGPEMGVAFSIEIWPTAPRGGGCALAPSPPAPPALLLFLVAVALLVRRRA
jgi:MYXO-CTERM domain-containing protein